MKVTIRIAFTTLCLLLLVCFVSLNLPVQMLVDFEAYGLEVENTQDARVKAGALRLRSTDFAHLGIVELSWNWCPGLTLLNWCTKIEADSLQAEGDIGYQLSGALELTEVRLELDSLELLGLVSGLVDAKLRGRVRSIEIRDFDCPLRNSNNLSAEFELVETQILGGALEDISVTIRQQDTDYLITAVGRQLEGEFLVDENLNYLGSGEMTPPANLVGMMGSLARPLGGGRYGWELKGQIPC